MKTAFILLVAICFLGCSIERKVDVGLSSPTPASLPSPTIASQPKLPEIVVSDVPKDTWKPIFFETIDERTAAGKIKKLREKGIVADVY